MITELRTYILDDAAIAAIIGTRLFPIKADQVDGTDPYAVYYFVNSTTLDTHSDSGLLRRDMLRINLHAPTATGILELSELFRTRLSNKRIALGSYDAHIVWESFANGYSDQDEIHDSAITLSITWS